MDLSISQMLQMQRDLYALHADSWNPLEPEYGKDSVLFMVEEIGEAIAVIKKKGSSAIMEDPVVREAFLSELADILMYYHDILLRYQISAEELSYAFLQKHAHDLTRDYTKEYGEKYHG